jgi:hypothetical protein
MYFQTFVVSGTIQSLTPSCDLCYFHFVDENYRHRRKIDMMSSSKLNSESEEGSKLYSAMKGEGRGRGTKLIPPLNHRTTCDRQNLAVNIIH